MRPAKQTKQIPSQPLRAAPTSIQPSTNSTDITTSTHSTAGTQPVRRRSLLYPAREPTTIVHVWQVYQLSSEP